MGKTMTSASHQTPRVKRRSDFFRFGKMLGKVGKRVLGPVSFASRGVSERSYLNSPAARRRSGINYMAELADYREVRRVEEVEENINRVQGDHLTKDANIVSALIKFQVPGGRLLKHQIGTGGEGLSIALEMSCQTQAQVFFLVWSGVSFSFNTSSGFAKGLTPDKLTGGWRGDLAKLSRTWEVMLIYCVILQSLLRVNSNFPPASVFTVCFKWNFKVFVLDTNVLMHHLEVAEVILHIINSLKFSK